MPSVPVTYVNPAFVPVEVVEAQRVDPLAKWIDELADYECRDCAPRFRRVDTNGYYSYSCLQFQMATFKSFSVKYKILTEDADFQEDIYDCSLQKKVALAMLEDNRDNWIHWQTSVNRGLGLPPQI